jgi:hypothetical protein
LEEVDLEEERQLQKSKEQKQKEWLDQVKNDPANEKQPFIPWDDECDLPKPDEEAIKKKTEQLLQKQEEVVEPVPEPSSSVSLEVTE